MPLTQRPRASPDRSHKPRTPWPRRPVLLRACLLGSLLAFSVAWAVEDPDAAIEGRERDLQSLKRQVETLSKDLIDRNAERRSLIGELEERERDVAALALAERELTRLVEEQTRVSRELRDREAQEQRSLEREIGRLSELLRTAHAMGRADVLRLLLNQEDPVRASRVLSYFAYFNRDRVGRIRAVESQAQRLALLAKDAEREAARLVALATQQEATRVRLEAAKAERAKILAGLEATIASREGDLMLLQSDAENLRLLVEHLRQRAQIQAELGVQREPFAQRRGHLTWPLLEGRIRSGFGSSKEGSEITLDGVLLVAREGEEVRAVYDGRVVYADWLRGFGMLLVIDHGDGYLTLYGHNQALLKEVGEWVAAGEAIALSGNSGGRDDPVLYFAIRRHGEPLDPAVWCG
jgi:murein hydrolase activator